MQLPTEACTICGNEGNMYTQRLVRHRFSHKTYEGFIAAVTKLNGSDIFLAQDAPSTDFS